MQFAFGKLKSLSFILVGALLTCSLVSTAVAKDKPAEALDFRGVIDDLDGYVNLRKEPRLNAPAIAKVSANEPFSFARAEAAKWCKVKLRSGITGWMHYSRIKLFFTNGDLPTKAEKDDEADEQARKQGLDYYQVSRAAARGDKAALDKFFRLDFDGAAAEEHVSVAAVVIHLLGDDAFANYLQEQPSSVLKGLTSGWELGVTYPFDTEEYFRQHFPKSARLLFRN